MKKLEELFIRFSIGLGFINLVATICQFIFPSISPGFAVAIGATLNFILQFTLF